MKRLKTRYPEPSMLFPGITTHNPSVVLKGSSARILLLLMALLVTSCMPGRKTAQNFLEKREQIAVMIVPPPASFLYYYPFTTETDQDTSDEGDMTDQSYFLSRLDVARTDSIFAASIIQDLARYSIQVFTPNEYDRFLSFSGSRFIFTIAQAELVESDRRHVDRALIDTILYRQEFLLRSVERNAWFEFVEVDAPDPDKGMKVLFSTFFTSDNISGRFRYRGLTGEVFYEYSSYIIDLHDIYSLQGFAGRGNARYIFEFLLNRYVQQNARPFLSRPVRFRYNLQTGQLSRMFEGQEFILLETNDQAE